MMLVITIRMMMMMMIIINDVKLIEMYKAAKAWSTWEGRISRLIQEPIENLKHSTDDQFALAFARIENHYFINKGFLPRDGFLLEKDQLDKIRHIPTFIVQGRYDVVCPPISAYLLHQSLPHSQLVYTLTGHSGMEKDIIHELVKATEMYKSL
jgi:proline iminopeptidase